MQRNNKQSEQNDVAQAQQTENQYCTRFQKVIS